jgi:hypothetical protein
MFTDLHYCEIVESKSSSLLMHYFAMFVCLSECQNNIPFEWSMQHAQRPSGNKQPGMHVWTTN